MQEYNNNDIKKTNILSSPLPGKKEKLCNFFWSEKYNFIIISYSTKLIESPMNHYKKESELVLCYVYWRGSFVGIIVVK